MLKIAGLAKRNDIASSSLSRGLTLFCEFAIQVHPVATRGTGLRNNIVDIHGFPTQATVINYVSTAFTVCF